MAIERSMLYRAGVRRSIWMKACVGAAHWLRTCAERSAQRRALAWLDDHALHDIGVTGAEAQAEAGKPFWRP